MKRILLLLNIFLLFCQLSKSQQILTENFADSANQQITSYGWGQIGPLGNNPILVSSSGLSYSGYVLSGIGNAAVVGSTGQDDYKDLYTGVSSGTVYTSFMLRVDTARTGDYFLGLLAIGSTNPYTGKVFVRLSSTGYYQLGVSKSFEPPVYGTDSFAVGITSLVVFKYKIITGTANDSISLYNFTSGFPATEPSNPLVSTNGGTSTDAASVGRVALRQGNVASSPSCTVDGIRVGMDWSDLNAATFNKPPGVSSFIVANIGSNNARITWNKPFNYNNATQTIVVFMKKGSAINLGTPTLNSPRYIADANFAGSGTLFQNDNQAKCIYIGDTTQVIVTGLQANVTYNLVAYIINDADSLYSFSSTTTAVTPTSAPGPATNFTFTTTGISSANLSWSKGIGYNNTRHTQLVYMKAGSPIITGLNSADPAFIPGDANFLGYGANYPFDSLAKCMYNGNNNNLSVSGLTPGTLYYVIIWGISTVDSVYSTAATTNGRTNSNGPASVTSLTFSSGSNTTARVSWIKPANYNNATNTTLLFVKEANPVSSGLPPTQNPSNINANSDFTGIASTFEYDTSAKCTFKGDTNYVNLTNLKIGTLYYLVNYVVSDSGYIYSNPTNGNGTTRSPMIGSVTSVSFTGLSKTSAKISWVKPVGYLNANFSTVVFVKPVDPIILGVPTRSDKAYTPSANINFGTRYQNDSLAHCVFNQDTNYININGLTSGVQYYAVIYIVRGADSTYAPETIINGYSLGTASVYTISQVNHVNQVTGVADSLNIRVTVRGLIYGSNLRTVPSTQFFIRDQTGGLMVFNNKDYSYKVTEGDSVEVQGIIAQSRGWTFIGTLDTIIFLSSGKTIKQTVLVTLLNEATENDFVKISNLNLFKPIIVWPSGINTTVPAHRTGMPDTINLRIYAASAIAGSLAPKGEFNAYGMGIQISSVANAPFPFDGYMIIPSKVEDFSLPPDTLSLFHLILPIDNAVIKLNGDPTNAFTVFFSRAKEITGLPPAHYQFLLDYQTGNFGTPLINLLLNNGSADTIADIPFSLVAKSIPNFRNGDSIIAKWIIKATTGNYTRLASDSRNITFKRGLFNGLSFVELNEKVVLTPNPAMNEFMIQSPLPLEIVQLIDITGKLVADFEPTDSYRVAHIPAGMYFVRMKIGDNTLVKKIIIGL